MFSKQTNLSQTSLCIEVFPFCQRNNSDDRLIDVICFENDPFHDTNYIFTQQPPPGVPLCSMTICNAVHFGWNDQIITYLEQYDASCYCQVINDYWTVLMAATSNKKLSTMKILIENGQADVNGVYQYEPEISPLYMAVMENFVEGVCLLIEHGADYRNVRVLRSGKAADFVMCMRRDNSLAACEREIGCDR
eukprot:451561_1